MSKEKAEPQTVMARLTQVVVDPNQYKPYTPTLTFDEVFVEIPMPEGTSLGSTHILTLRGLTALLETVADELEAMHLRRQRRAASRRD